MKATFLLMLSVLSICARAGSDVAQRPAPFARVCGKVVRVEKVPIKNLENSFEERVKALPHVAMRLFSSSGANECCTTLAIAAETKTGRWGDFKFTKISAGTYWLVAHVEGREYKSLIRYEPNKDPHEKCSDAQFQVTDSGTLQKREFITVD
jgi:hypothetical protein